MRTRIFSVPSSGTPSAAWQAGNATTGQAGAILPFMTGAGQTAGSTGTLEGPGSYISAQFSMATAPASLYVALDTNGSTAGATINLEGYANFAWTILDASSLSAASSAAVALPAASQLGLLRLRVSISGNASATCVAILNTTAAAQGTGVPTTTAGEQNGLIPIAAGADRVTINFSPSFGAVPLPPICGVLKATDADDTIFWTGIQSLTANSCVALLSSAAPNANYKLSYRAVPAS